jgi:transcriptional regulator with XRE-family HTH domain
VKTEFGALLRKWREEAGVTMGHLARSLGVHVPYLSDVERGVRPPLSEERIQIVAGLLERPAEDLLAAASRSRGPFQLSARNVSARQAKVGAALARGWEQLTEEQLRQIEQALQEEDQ